MTHPGAYHAERHPDIAGHRCPAVAGHIKSERYSQADHLPDRFQIMIDYIAGVAICATLVNDGVFNYRELK